MGYEACLNALKKNNPQSGSIGAGTGATVGKMCGMKQSQKSGIGYYAMQIGDLKIGAVVVVNAMGDVYAEGRKIAGLMNESRTNTTLGDDPARWQRFVDFDKAQLTRIAQQARNAYARCINPVGTLIDGDTVYASSCGEQVTADVNMTGTLAAEVMAKAIERAITTSQMDDEEYLSYCLDCR